MRCVRIVAVAGLLALLVACGDSGTTKQAGPAPDVYRTRGVVERLPQADGPDKAIYIRHAAIPEFQRTTPAPSSAWGP